MTSHYSIRVHRDHVEVFSYPCGCLGRFPYADETNNFDNLVEAIKKNTSIEDTSTINPSDIDHYLSHQDSAEIYTEYLYVDEGMNIQFLNFLSETKALRFIAQASSCEIHDLTINNTIGNSTLIGYQLLGNSLQDRKGKKYLVAKQATFPATEYGFTFFSGFKIGAVDKDRIYRLDPIDMISDKLLYVLAGGQ